MRNLSDEEFLGISSRSPSRTCDGTSCSQDSARVYALAFYRFSRDYTRGTLETPRPVALDQAPGYEAPLPANAPTHRFPSIRFEAVAEPPAAHRNKVRT